MISRSAYTERLLAELNDLRKVALAGKMESYDIGYNNGLSMAYAMVLNAPAVDAVEVVRCKDCKYCKPSAAPGRYFCDWRREYSETFLSDFCSYGERRTDDEAL